MAYYATLNSLRMDIDGCWKLREYVPFIQQGPHRGTDYTAQGVDGDTFRAKSTAALRVTVPILFYGQNDKDGSSHPDVWSGIRDNVEQAYTSWVTASKTSAITLTVTYADGATRTGSVYCPNLSLALHVGHADTVVRGELDIVMLGGKLAAP